MADNVVVDVESAGERKDSASESPEHINEKESPEEQSHGDTGNAESIPKDWKVWSEEETRSLIQLYKTYVLEYPEYSRKLLWEEISQGLKKLGYTKNPERVRNRMKSLRTAYRRTVDYNAKHILKKQFAYLDDLDGLYNVVPALSDDNDNSSNSAYNVTIDRDEENYSVASENSTTSKKLRLVRTSKTVRPEVEVIEVPKSKLTSRSFPKINSSIKKKLPTKNAVFPLYQCGQCFGKFSTSQEMHSHNCEGPVQKPQMNGNKKDVMPKKKSVMSSQNNRPFTWTGMATLQFLEFLKEFKLKMKNSNFRSGNLLQDLSGMMRKHGLSVSPELLKKKWKSLAVNYEKTVCYNKKHRDKKKCAFYNRLNELYKLGASFEMFDAKKSEKMATESLPFSFPSSEANMSTEYVNSELQNGFYPDMKMSLAPNDVPNNTTNLVQWLDLFWKEWKELEKKKEQANAQRHTELMEVLSCLAESVGK